MPTTLTTLEMLQKVFTSMVFSLKKALTPPLTSLVTGLLLRGALTLLPEIDLNANGITLGTSVTVFLEASKFNADSQTSFFCN